MVRPSTPDGTTDYFPILPLAVVCKDDSERKDLQSIEALFSIRKTSDTNLITAFNIVRALSEINVLKNKGPFYPVVMGLQPAVYRDW
jgi:hypothetical protein